MSTPHFNSHTSRIAILPLLVLLVISLIMLLEPISLWSTEMAIEPFQNLSYSKLALDNIPLYFIENQGQVDARVHYYIQGQDKTLYFTSEGVTFTFNSPIAPFSSLQTSQKEAGQRWALKLLFLDANPSVRPFGREKTPTVVSYFKGSQEEWQTGLHTYTEVVYPDIWPGIDLIYTGDGERLKYTFVVQPGADPGLIRLAYQGATSVELSEAGRITVMTPLGGFEDEQPFSYQEEAEGQVPVTTNYALESNPEAGTYIYGFHIGDYDHNRPLVIDPTIIVYAGYIGGTGSDESFGLAVDEAGNAYITGITASTEASFPVTGGPDLTYNGGTYDAFVAKVNPTGTGLEYLGFIGGSNADYGFGIAVDGVGNAYISGYTVSTEATFPVLAGPDLTYNGGSYDAFVAKVNATGTALDYAGYIGGSGHDRAHQIVVDGVGNAFLTGRTSSTEMTFPVLVGPDLTHNGGTYDAFVAKVNATGTVLEYAGYIGGSNTDNGYGIGIDGAGNAYISGYTASFETSFPVTVGPDLTYNGGAFDAFVAKVNATGTALDYAGFIGGNDDDFGYDIAVDEAGNAYITGGTDSTQASFPETVGPDLTFNGGAYDAFVAKVNLPGTGLEYAGYIGGSGGDEGYGIAVDEAGNAYVTGYTSSTETTFPVLAGPDLTYNGGTYDAFIAKVDVTGMGFTYAGYIGGSNSDEGNTIAVDGTGHAYVAGITGSSEASFPVIGGPDLTYNGNDDSFIVKIYSDNLPSTPTDTSTPTSTSTQTSTPTASLTPTHTPTPTSTATPSPTATSTSTVTVTPTHTATSTATHTPTPTATSTATFTPSPSITPYPTSPPALEYRIYLPVLIHAGE